MLEQIAIVLVAAVVLVPLSQRLGFGSVLGYLAAGMVTGPWVLGAVRDVESILHFSELGVILLLFVIGLELQPSRLWVLRRPVFGLGSAQVGVTALVIGGTLMLLGWRWNAAAAAGVALALSSTAFVLQMLAERRELATRHGREAFAILLFQDLAVIPLLAALPLAAAPDGGGAGGFDALAALRAVGAVALLLVLGRRVLTVLFNAIARLGNREIFTATALLVVVGTAWLMTVAGLSTSLGAFLAGVLLADSEFRHEIEADLSPFKGLLLGLFFVAVGMSVNLGLVLAEPVVLGAAAVALVLVKFGLIWGIGRLAGSRGDAPRNLAVALAAGGEFAFVVFALMREVGLLDAASTERLVVIVTLSMVLAPVLFLAEDRWRRWCAENPDAPEYDTIDEPGNPVVVIGFGRVGQIVTRILRMRGIAFTALDASVEQVDFVRRFGSKVYYGDASRTELLTAAKVAEAKLVVLAIGNIEASLKIAQALRRMCPQVPVLARARDRTHCHALADLGVDWFIRDTYLSSLALAERTLVGLGFEAADARRSVDTFRVKDSELLQRQRALRRDDAALMQSARETAEELRRLFDDDAGPAGEASLEPAAGTPR